MSRRCEVTGKQPLVGHRVSHSNSKSKRRQMVNLQRKRIWLPEEGRHVRLRLATSALRTIDKIGAAEALRRRR